MSPSRSGDEVDVPGVARARRRARRRTPRRAGTPRRRVACASARAQALRVARDREVDVVGVAAEQPVAHRAADQPRVLARPALRAAASSASAHA